MSEELDKNKECDENTETVENELEGEEVESANDSEQVEPEEIESTDDSVNVDTDSDAKVTEIHKECEGVSKVSPTDRALKEKLNEKSSQLMRLAADFDNFKKRQRKNTELQVQNFAEKLMKGLLPVLDSMDRAKESLQDEDIEHLREGFVQIHDLFHHALSEAGVSSMDVLGEQFDPRYHEALMHHPAEGAEPGTITVELQKGWAMGERILRAARVGVAPDAPAEPVDEPEMTVDNDPEAVEPPECESEETIENSNSSAEDLVANESEETESEDQEIIESEDQEIEELEPVDLDAAGCAISGDEAEEKVDSE